MTLTNDQLEDRILVIEATLNSIQIAINNLATKREMKELIYTATQTELSIDETSILAVLSTRVEAMENLLNNIQTAISNLVAKKEMKTLLNIREQELSDLQTAIVSLQAQVDLLQS